CVPNLTCAGGTVKNNECVCPSGMHAEKSGPNAYRCLANLVCRGGVVRDGKCVCPKGTNLTSMGDNNIFACVRAPTGGATQGSTGSTSGQSTGGTSGGQTGGQPPTLKLPQGGLVPR